MSPTLSPALLPEIIATKILVRSSGCWGWTGGLDREGYGRSAVRESRGRGVHRVVYELLIGRIPSDHDLDHLCHNRDPNCRPGKCAHRRCVNPAHLDPVDHRSHGAQSPRHNLLKTHCPQGHPYDDANTHFTRGRRQCRICMKENGRRWRTAHPDYVPPGQSRPVGAPGGRVPPTSCKRGHPFDEANTYTNPTTGQRSCRICRAAWMRQYRANAR